MVAGTVLIIIIASILSQTCDQKIDSFLMVTKPAELWSIAIGGILREGCLCWCDRTKWLEPLHEQFVQKIRNHAYFASFNLFEYEVYKSFFNTSLIIATQHRSIAYICFFIRINIELLDFLSVYSRKSCSLLGICFLLRLGYLFSNSIISRSCRLNKLNHKR